MKKFLWVSMAIGMVFGLLGCGGLPPTPNTNPTPPTAPVTTPIPTPTTPTPTTPTPTTPVQHGYLEVCVTGLGIQPGDWPYKLMSYWVDAGGQWVRLTAEQPCKVLTDELTGLPLKLPAGAQYEVRANPGAWGLRAEPERQTATITANTVVRATVKVGWW